MSVILFSLTKHANLIVCLDPKGLSHCRYAFYICRCQDLQCHAGCTPSVSIAALCPNTLTMINSAIASKCRTRVLLRQCKPPLKSVPSTSVIHRVINPWKVLLIHVRKVLVYRYDSNIYDEHKYKNLDTQLIYKRRNGKGNNTSIA
jgi:hypothetical protein